MKPNGSTHHTKWGKYFSQPKRHCPRGQKEKAQITHSNLRRHCNQKRNDEIVQKTPKQKWVIKNKIQPDTESQTPRARRREPDLESQTPQAQNQEMRKTLNGMEILQKESQRGHPYNQHLNSKLNLVN